MEAKELIEYEKIYDSCYTAWMDESYFIPKIVSYKDMNVFMTEHPHDLLHIKEIVCFADAIYAELYI